MNIIPLDNRNRQKWDEFCMGSRNAWFWHTTHWMDYVAEYKPELQPLQMSFLVEENNSILAICPLMLENRQGIKEFSFSSFAVPTPVLSDSTNIRKQKKILDFIFEYIDRQAGALTVKKVSFRSSPLADPYAPMFGNHLTYLLKYGYTDATFNTQLIDISREPEQIKGEITKGHRHDMNRASRLFDINVYDAQSVDPAIFREYCELHHRDAGRVTRPQITFDMMYNWVKSGHAILVGAKLKGDNRFSGFTYHITYKNSAYYASACSDPECGGMPVAHGLIWESMRWLHDRGVKFFETGWQFYGTELHHRASQKEIQIAKFKRGFGGVPTLQIVAEKFYDADVFAEGYMMKQKYYKEYVRQACAS